MPSKRRSQRCIRFAPRPTVWWAALAVLMVALSGCTSGGDDRHDHGDHSHARDDPPEGFQEEDAGGIPLWFPGLFYTYSAKHHPTGSEGELDFVVLDGPDTRFTMDPVEEDGSDDALLGWALYWGLPVGPVKDTDFEPRHDGDPLGLFSFPIEDSDTWDGAALDGQDVTYAASLTEVVLPEGDTVPGYAVIGERDGEEVIRYTYTSWVGWFTSLWWDATGDGEPEITLELEQMTVRRELVDRPLRSPERLLDLEVGGPDAQLGDVPGTPHEARTFDVGDPDEPVYLLAHFDGGPGLYDVNLTYGADEGHAGWRWLNTEDEPTESWESERLIMEADEADVTVTVLASGTGRVVAFQMVAGEE